MATKGAPVQVKLKEPVKLPEAEAMRLNCAVCPAETVAVVEPVMVGVPGEEDEEPELPLTARV